MVLRNLLAAVLALAFTAPLAAQMLPTPLARFGEGPHEAPVIRGATIITGNGGPPYGPADIIVKNGRIADIRSAGTPGLAMAENRPPSDATREIDATRIFFDWTTTNEVNWRNFHGRYMRLINDYKNMGGRMTTGSDPGFIWHS